MTWQKKHDCGCGHRRDDKRDHNRDHNCDDKRDHNRDHSCKRRRSVIVQCCHDNCIEVQRPRCNSCDHLFRHHFDTFGRDCDFGCKDW